MVFNAGVKERTFMCASMAASSGDPAKELILATRLMNSITEGVDGKFLKKFEDEEAMTKLRAEFGSSATDPKEEKKAGEEE